MSAEGPAAFQGAWFKLKWAKERGARFAGLAETMASHNADLIRTREDRDAGMREYFISRVPIAPVEFTLIAGEILHALRCALDHVAFAIAGAGPGGESKRREFERDIQFPSTNRDLNALTGNKSFRRLVKLARPGLERVLIDLEPYNGGRGHWITELTALNNIDKHRLLITIALQAPAIDIGPMLEANAREAMQGMFENVREKLIRDGQKGAEHEPFPELFPEPLSLLLKNASKSAVTAGEVLFREPLSERPSQPKFNFPIAINEPAVVPVQPLTLYLGSLVAGVENTIPLFDSFVR